MFLRAVLFALLIPAMGTVGEASAQQRVIVEAFSGPQGSALRSVFVRNLQDNGVTVVPRAEVDASAAEQGIRARRLNADSCVQLGRALNASACISGRVNRARRRWSLAVRVRNAIDGSSLGARSWGGRTAGALRGVGRSGYARLSGVLNQAQAPAPEVSEGDSNWYDVDETPVEDVLDEELAFDEPDEPIGDRQRYESLSVAAGVGTLSRSLVTTVGVGCGFRTINMPPGCGSGSGSLVVNEERSYVSGGIGAGELSLSVDAYPGTFGEEQSLPWLGLRASYHMGIGLVTQGFSDTGNAVQVTTSQSELYLGARARLRFGETRDDPHLIFDAGYGIFSFSFDTDELAMLARSNIVPPVDYSYLHLGVSATYGLIPVYLQIGARFGYRFGLGVGRDALSIWGVNSYLSSSFNLGVELTSEAPYIVDGLFFRLAADYSIFRSVWQGNSQCRAPNPTTGMCSPQELWEPWPHVMGSQDTLAPGGGIPEPISDAYLRLHVAIGYSLR